MNAFEMLQGVKSDEHITALTNLTNALEEHIGAFEDLGKSDIYFQHLLCMAICICIFNRVKNADEAMAELDAFAKDFLVLGDEAEILFNTFTSVLD